MSANEQELSDPLRERPFAGGPPGSRFPSKFDAIAQLRCEVGQEREKEGDGEVKQGNVRTRRHVSSARQ